MLLASVGGAHAADTGRIYGIVLDDETGKPIPGVQVRAAWSGAHVAPGPKPVTTNKSGEFTFDLAAPGGYLLAYVPPPPYVRDIPDIEGIGVVEVPVDPSRITKIVKRLKVGGEILLRTVRLDGSPWDSLGRYDVNVSVTAPSNGAPFSLSGFGGNWTRTPDNHLLAAGVPPTTTATVDLQAPGHAGVAFQGVAVRARERTVLTATFDPSDPTGIEGQAWPEAYVHAYPEEETQSPRVKASRGDMYADQAGRFAIVGLKPGRYDVRISGGGRSERLQVLVEPGKRTQITLPTQGSTFMLRHAADTIMGLGRWVVPTAHAASAGPPREPTIDSCKIGTLVVFSDPGRAKEVVIDAFEKARQKILDCLAPTCRDKLLPYLFDQGRLSTFLHMKVTLRIGCGGCGDACAKVPTVAGATIMICDDFTKPGWCDEACLESAIFHELTHVAGYGECNAYMCTKACFGDCAPEPRSSYTLVAMSGRATTTEKCWGEVIGKPNPMTCADVCCK